MDGISPSQIGSEQVTIELGGGGGAGASVECMSPANAVPESRHASVIANTKRLIFRFSLKIEHPTRLSGIYVIDKCLSTAGWPFFFGFSS